MHATISRPGAPTSGVSRDWKATLADLSNRWSDSETERVAYVTQNGDVRFCANVSEHPKTEWRVLPGQWAEVLDSAVLVIHAHPSGIEVPSYADQRSQIATQIPFAIVPRGGTPFVWGAPDSSDLVGRPYRWGVNDCFGIWREFFQRETGRTFPDFPRRWKFWKHAEPVFENALRYVPFTNVDSIDSARRGDGILFRLRTDVWCHCAAYLGAGRMLHHPAPLRPYDESRLSLTTRVERYLHMPHKILRFASA